MHRYVKIGLFGFLIWLISFLVSIVIYPLHDTNRPLFESIMPVVLAAVVIVFSILYMRRLKMEILKESVVLGITWLIINLILDLILFLPESPMQMSLGDYMMDIGLTYLLIPLISIGMGYIRELTPSKNRM
jgi:hypothetical protein